MDAAYNRHARRSNTNLNHLSLAPLTPKLPLYHEHELLGLDAPPIRSSSYLEGRSAPTTPGILSRSPSTHRLRHRNAHPQEQSLPKSKSSSHLLLPQSRRNRGLRPLTPRQTTSASPEWLLRTGAVLSYEARESKGQTWLTGRASSTSLVSYADEDDGYFQHDVDGDLGHIDDTAFADDEYSPVSARPSRGASRAASRGGSGMGSRVELRSPLGDVEENVFDDGFAREPDFVDELNEREREEDAELDELTRQRTHGLGGLLDRLMNWSLFSSADDDDDVEDHDHDVKHPINENGSSESPNHARPSADLATKNPSSSHLDDKQQTSSAPAAAVNRNEPDADSEWQDYAAWLLSVASRTLM